MYCENKWEPTMGMNMKTKPDDSNTDSKIKDFDTILSMPAFPSPNPYIILYRWTFLYQM